MAEDDALEDLFAEDFEFFKAIKQLEASLLIFIFGELESNTDLRRNDKVCRGVCLGLCVCAGGRALI